MKHLKHNFETENIFCEKRSERPRPVFSGRENKVTHIRR